MERDNNHEFVQAQEAAKTLLGDFYNQLEWRWDERNQAILTEFARNRGDEFLPKINDYCSQRFDHKSFKKLSKSMQNQLGTFAKLEDNQQLLLQPISDSNFLVIGWWPWGHGATISLRIKLQALDTTIVDSSLWDRLKGLWRKS